LSTLSARYPCSCPIAPFASSVWHVQFYESLSHSYAPSSAAMVVRVVSAMVGRNVGLDMGG